jgi:alkylated DNA repair dioxygenase AlkB
MAQHQSDRREAISAEEIVNFRLYPIADMDSPEARELVIQSRSQFADAVSCHLPNFVNPIALQRAIDELPSMEQAHLYDQNRGAYDLEDPKASAYRPTFRSDDPMAKLHRRHQYWFGQDDLEAQSVLCTLYAWPNLTRFMAAVLQQEPLFTIDDPLMGVLINVSSQGDELGWHVDSHDFAITLLLQKPERGGVYQYVPHTGPGDENFGKVPALFAGDESEVRTVPMEPGSLVLFRGRNTLHRVTPSQGDRQRLLALFAYEPVPHRVFGPSFRRRLLGRVDPRMKRVAVQAG